jgi:arylsulfatase A-like enzyme/Tfp pilus assembly protein PilF
MFRGRRRLSLVAAAAVLLAAGAGLVLWTQRTSKTETTADLWTQALGGLRPEQLNVVLVTIDTLRADRLSSYGSPRELTPALDALAADGVRFANAATTVPFTLPAHSSIMTGTYPPFHGVRENVGYVLDERQPTLAERLAGGGWATAGFVSALVLDARWGIGRGFDTYFDDFEGVAGDSSEGGAGVNLGSVQRDGAETLAAALRWLDGAPTLSLQGRPFFLWLHLFDPHDPYTPPEPFRSRFPEHPYDAEVAYADSLVGKLIEDLSARGLLETSVVAVTGDHGEGLGDHGEGFHGFFVYDSTVHVPLILRLPGRLGHGRTVAEAVSHVDLLPTLLEATGQPLPPDVQGRSLLPLALAAEPAADAEPAAVYSESLYPLLHYGWAPLRVLRSGRYKLIDAPEPELYDLDADPGERTNLLREERSTYARLRDRLAAVREQIERSEAEAPRADVDAETLEQLRTLGYAAGRGGVSLDEEDDRTRADPKHNLELHQLVMAAQSALGAGEEKRAGEMLERALAGDPGLIDAHRMLGTIALRQERPVDAAGHFQRALEVHADDTAARLGLADAYRRQGRREDALAGYDLVLADHPDDGHALLASSDVLVELGRRGEAIERLRPMVADDDRPLLLNRLGELLTVEGRGDEAEPLFRRAVADDDRLPGPRFNLAVLLEEQGRIEEAMELYQATIERAPRHYQAMFNLGRIHGRLGDLDRQQQLWEQALASEPDFPRGYFLLAKLLMDRGGDLARAEELLRKGLAIDPEHRAGPLGHYVLADVLNRLGRPAAAAAAVVEGRRIEAQTRESG